MHQQASGPNSAQVGRDIISSTVTIRQENHVAGNLPPFVQLELDLSSMHRYSKGEVQRKAVRGSVVVAIPLTTTFISLFADSLGILNYLGGGQIFTTYFSLLVGLGLATLTTMIEHKNVVGLYLWIKSKSMKRCEGRLIQLNKFLEIDAEGNYLTFSLSSSCIYPACNGKIIVTGLPLRERHREQLAGICSVAGKAHSYLIDYNWVAVPRDLDWRPPEPPHYNSGYPGYGR